jgi:N-methylhydantoinase A/oxoprolinase/acetone carboxylase beta subunit
VRRGVPPAQRGGAPDRGALAGADGARHPSRRHRSRRPARADCAAATDEPPAPRAHRRVHTGDDWHDAPVYDGEALRPGPHFEGPALVGVPVHHARAAPGATSPRSNRRGDVVVDIALP